MSKKILIIILFVILIAAFGGPEYLFIKETKQFNMTAEAINASGPNTKIGFAAQTYELNFGRLPLGGRSTKFIDVSNTFKSPVKIKTIIEGNIKQFIDLSDDEILLEPEKNTQLKITFNSLETGNFSGNIKIVTYVPKYNMVNGLVEYR
ncbi:MAG: hypothetical protein V1718_03930 [archaeon]